jgi:microcystin-dependent protein
MRRDDGVPLPHGLSGEIVERTIKIDRSLIPIVSGALEWITDYQRYEQTGAYTVEQARADLANMLYFYFSGQTAGAKMYAGFIQPYAGTLPLPGYLIDQGWLACDGAILDQDDYPDLFAAISCDYCDLSIPEGQFQLPDLRGRVPIGAGQGEGLSLRFLGQELGEEQHVLTIEEMPAHTHTLARSGAGAGNNPQAASGTVAGAYTTSSAGLTQSHNNMQPSLAINFIIMTRNPG